MPAVRTAALVAAYATLGVLGASWALGAWTAAHALAAGLLVAVGTPWLVVQGLVTLVRGEPTARHRAIAGLSLAFPAVLAAVVLVVFGLR